MASALLRTKSIDRLLSEAEATGERTLKRTLGGWSLVALGIGGIIGAGIFVRTAAAIAERSGPAVGERSRAGRCRGTWWDIVVGRNAGGALYTGRPRP